MRYIIILIGLFLWTSCIPKFSASKLGGKIIYTGYPDPPDTIKLFYATKYKRIGPIKYRAYPVHSLIWSQSSESIYGYVDYNKADSLRKSAIVIHNTNGEFEKLVYESDRMISDFMPSFNDSLIVVEDKAYDYYGRGSRINIVDVKTGSTLKSFKISSPVDNWERNLWDSNSSEVIITKYDEKSSLIEKREVPSIYLYNIDIDSFKFITNGFWPSYNQAKNIIAYFNVRPTDGYNVNRQLWFYDLQKNEKYIFFQDNDRFRLIDYYFAPDGKSVLVYCKKHEDRFLWERTDTYLINIDTKKKTKVKGYFNIDSWTN